MPFQTRERLNFTVSHLRSRSQPIFTLIQAAQKGLHSTLMFCLFLQESDPTTPPHSPVKKTAGSHPFKSCKRECTYLIVKLILTGERPDLAILLLPLRKQPISTCPSCTQGGALDLTVAPISKEERSDLTVLLFLLQNLPIQHQRIGKEMLEQRTVVVTIVYITLSYVRAIAL